MWQNEQVYWTSQSITAQNLTFAALSFHEFWSLEQYTFVIVICGLLEVNHLTTTVSLLYYVNSGM